MACKRQHPRSKKKRTSSFYPAETALGQEQRSRLALLLTLFDKKRSPRLSQRCGLGQPFQWRAQIDKHRSKTS